MNSSLADKLLDNLLLNGKRSHKLLICELATYSTADASVPINSEKTASPVAAAVSKAE